MRELKPSFIREMTADEIRVKIRELGEEMFNLRFRNSMRQLDNPLEIRNLRKERARLWTILAEHESGHRALEKSSIAPAETTKSGGTAAKAGEKMTAKAAEKKTAKATDNTTAKESGKKTEKPRP